MLSDSLWIKFDHQTIDTKFEKWCGWENLNNQLKSSRDHEKFEHWIPEYNTMNTCRCREGAVARKRIDSDEPTFERMRIPLWELVKSRVRKNSLILRLLRSPPKLQTCFTWISQIKIALIEIRFQSIIIFHWQFGCKKLIEYNQFQDKKHTPTEIAKKGAQIEQRVREEGPSHQLKSKYFGGKRQFGQYIILEYDKQMYSSWL